jgi:hypothetical protein
MRGPEHPLSRRRPPGWVRAAGDEIGASDVEEIREVSRCGTNHRNREAITAAAKNF